LGIVLRFNYRNCEIRSPASQSRFERLTQLKPPALPGDIYSDGDGEVLTAMKDKLPGTVKFIF
jgi:hypothetical protein